MSISKVSFTGTDVSFDRGRFGCWLKINSYTEDTSMFGIFLALDVSYSYGIGLLISEIPTNPTLTLQIIDDVGNISVYSDENPILLDTWYFIEVSWNHITPAYHMYIDNVERTIDLIYSDGTPIISGTAGLLQFGYLGIEVDRFDIGLQNILFSNLDTRDLYALR